MHRIVFLYSCMLADKDFSIEQFPVKALKSFGDGYASAFLFGIFNGWNMIECLEFGSASASLLEASCGCSADMPSEEKVRQFIKEYKMQYGETVARGDKSYELR